MTVGAHWPRFAWLATACLTVAMHAAWSKDLAERKWIEVTTPNFQIRSLQSEKKTVELARYLEAFRAAVNLATSIRSTEAPIPTLIYVMRGARDFAEFGLDRSFAGVFVPGLRDNMILLRNTRGIDETTVILHEYVHFLVRNHGRQLYPQWYDEGFAEYLSSSRLRKKHIDIGLPAQHRINSLLFSNWIPVRTILAPEGYPDWRDEKKAMFYAEAWLLVTYLYNQPDQRAVVGNTMLTYTRLVESGKTDVEAFETAFGLDTADLNFQLRRYMERGQMSFLRLKLEQLVPDFEPKVIRLSHTQASLELGKLALRRGKLDLAERWFSIAAEDELTRPWGEAGLGDVFKFRKDFETAQSYFETAIELAPNDPYIQLDMAEYWHQLAADEDVSAEQWLEHLQRARSYYIKAWQLDDSMPETYAMYGDTFLMDGSDFGKAIEVLEQAEQLLPSNIAVRLMLAQAYAGANRADDARDAARSVLAWSHEESDVAKAAAEILAKLDKAGNEE